VGDTIAEATSGNTGIAFAAIGRALGHPVLIFMPDWMSPERAALIRSFGARIEPVSKAQGGFLGSIALCESLARQRDDVFLPCQFSNSFPSSVSLRPWIQCLPSPTATLFSWPRNWPPL
jgi:cysteine synthase A